MQLVLRSRNSAYRSERPVAAFKGLNIFLSGGFFQAYVLRLVSFEIRYKLQSC